MRELMPTLKSWTFLVVHIVNIYNFMAGILGIIDVESYKAGVKNLGACIESEFTPQINLDRDKLIADKKVADKAVTASERDVNTLSNKYNNTASKLDKTAEKKLNDELNDAKNKLKNNTTRQTDLANKIDKLKIFYPFPESLGNLLQYDTKLAEQFKKNIADFINMLPVINVRSYFINSALLEAITLVAGTGNLVTGSSWSALKDKGKSTIDCFKALLQTGGLSTLRNELTKGFKPAHGVSSSSSINLYKLPEILYYRLTTTTTNNTYNIPCEINSGFFDSRSAGWNNRGNLFAGGGTGLFAVLKQTNGLDVMPTFNLKTGSNNVDTLQISLDLINDNDTAAVANTQFIRTLHILNQWIQYGPVQFPGNLYDISIPGTGQRWFMCTANISVNSKGSIRYIGNNPKFSNLGLTTTELDEFRIPDVYSLTIEFNSLIPNNLNNFLLAKVAEGDDFMGKASFLPLLFNNLKTALNNVKDFRNDITKRKNNNIVKINQLANEAALNEYAAAQLGTSNLETDADNQDIRQTKAYKEAFNTYSAKLVTENYGEKDSSTVKYLADKLAKEEVEEIDTAIANRRAALVETAILQATIFPGIASYYKYPANSTSLASTQQRSERPVSVFNPSGQQPQKTPTTYSFNVSTNNLT